MIRPIKYFQSVVRNNSFSEAAEECNISQSAISQQIQSLERTLGFQLLERKSRKFTLTPAGEYFYKKSLVLTDDYDRICAGAARIAHADTAVLRIGYLRSFSGPQFRRALVIFTEMHPNVTVKLSHGSHEELFEHLRTNTVDMVFNDQRGAFTEEYIHQILSISNSYIEISHRSLLSKLDFVTLQDLKNTPCILVTSPSHQDADWRYYRDVIGFQGDFVFAENLAEARLITVGGNGFLPSDKEAEMGSSSTCCIPLFRENMQLTQTYCAFWKNENSGYYIEEFAELLRNQFQER